MFSEPAVNYVEILAEIGKEQQFKIVYVEIEEMSKKDRQVSFQFTISSLPVPVFNIQFCGPERFFF
jgi:hypothetical protein